MACSLSLIEQLENVLDSCDYPVYIERDEVEKIFEELKPINWESYSQSTEKCEFCRDVVNFRNKKTKIAICESCMYEIYDQEFDVVEPKDHPMSIKLRSLLCDWIDRNQWVYVSSYTYFVEMKIAHNTCGICQQVIKNFEEMAVPGCARMVAHLKCAEEHGFRNYFTQKEYDDILSDMVEGTALFDSWNAE